MKIAFLAPYPQDRVASQRFRFEQYFKSLKEKGITYEFYCFYPLWAFNILYRKNRYIKKMLGILTGYFRRFYHLLACLQAERIMIHRELAPFGPPVFEWILIFVFRKKIIFDFDDAIWISDNPPRNKWLGALKWYQKFGFICRHCYRISAGNPYLADYATRYHSRVTINPSTIDNSLTHFMHVNHREDTVTIGWTGSHSTLKYLESILGPLQQILIRFNQARLLVICDQKPEWELKGMEFLYWNKTTEWEDLRRIQIGIMPLPDNTWTRGKGGFKILEYFSMGIPSVASPVGINTVLIEHGKNGFLCNREEDWTRLLDRLIQDPSLREKMGQAGKKMVEERFSLQSNLATFLGLFE
jgi:glycosyltransferase involved in cell wall biosynthesis